MKEIYLKYAAYNLWANRRMAELFANLTEEEAVRHIESSFPSVKKTVLHIWDAEQIWLKRLRDESIEDFPSKSFAGGFSAALSGWLAESEAFLGHMENLSDTDFHEVKSYRSILSGAYSQKVYEMVHHCMNHSTYHRGQLVTFARQLGLKSIPSTDMVFYLREMNEVE